jgi:hypothetical protein
MPPSTRIRRARLWLLAASATVASGCALIGGLDQYTKGDAESPDAVADQTVNDVANPDAPTSDSGNDVGQPDASGDVVVADVQDGGVSDAPADGCGALNTIDNCTMCGAQCDGTNASSTQCNGTTCLYACKTGYANCDAAAPDLNGCECPTPTCCGAGCATTHMNGIGQNYYDCVDAGTYSAQQALKACTAYTTDQTVCTTYGCNSDAGDSMICGYPDGGGCACWTYVGLDMSHVYKSGTTNCFCPSTNDPTWN